MSAQRKDLQEPLELIEHRTMHGKTFLLPDGRLQVSSCVRPFHWNDNGTWINVDDVPHSEDGEVWTTKSTPYAMSWDIERLELRFEKKRGGEVIIRLVALNSIPVSRLTVKPTISSRSVKIFVAPELEIELRCRPHGVELFKILHGPNAPRRLTWEVTENNTSHGVHARLMETMGYDNCHRRVEILHSRTDVSANTYRVTEEFTGRTRFIDPVSHARSWVQEVKWPVEIDVTVTVPVGADADDGNGLTGSTYWYQNNFWTGHTPTTRYGAVRFTNVNIPQGQTLDSATLTVNCTSRGGTQSAVLAGNNVDNAALWANGSANGPKTMAATTANTTFATPATTGIKTIDVLAIVQEIINRAGWAANNALRLGFTDATAMTTSYFFFEDFSASLSNPAKLDIVYTPVSTNFLLGQGCM